LFVQSAEVGATFPAMTPHRALLLASLALTLALLAPTVHAQSAAESDHPPIAVTFRLREPGFVTLAIDDADGRRVRNLVSETPFPAGANTVWWDGLDDLGRDPDAAAHAIYHIPGRFVAPGRYAVRGLVRQAVDLRYEFTVYNPGRPPWHTKSRKSEWLTNHTPPGTLCFLPAGAAPVREGDAGSPAQVLIGSYVAEGGSGLAWVDLDGRKLHGQMWVGGVWTGAELLTRDAGPEPVPGVYAYVASSWKGDQYNDNQAEIRLHKLVNDAQRLAAPRDTRMGTGEDPAVLAPTWKFPAAEQVGVGGLAAWNGLVVVSLPKMDALLLVDVARSNVLGTAALPEPRGLAFDPQGRLLAVSRHAIVRVALPPKERCAERTELPTPEVLVAAGLEAPQQLALDAAGNVYVSDHGACNQVKVFAADSTHPGRGPEEARVIPSPEGQAAEGGRGGSASPAAWRLLRTIGTAGVPKAGPYDRTRMHNPRGLALDDRGQLWVAEDDFAPKRVSVWTTDGRFVRAFYGPPEYGGGGVLDSGDPSLFHLNGMTFRINWKTGANEVTAIRWRPGPDDFKPPRGHHAGGPPDTALYLGKRKYYTDCFLGSPTGGSRVLSLWRERNGVAVPVASFGDADVWDWLKTEPLLARVPFDPKKKRDPNKEPDLSGFLFVWSDLNGDGRGQPEEVQFAAGGAGSGVTVGPDLSLVNGQAQRFAPARFEGDGVPVYDLAAPTVLCPDPQRPTSSGGGQVLMAADGWTVLTTAPKPFAPQSLGGARDGAARWSYPSPWPGLHASHIAPPPEFPGEVIGTTRLLGPAFVVSREFTLWAINGNKGSIYLFTTDGLFVATLFQDCRAPKSAWSEREAAVRNMPVNDLTNGEESFWPAIVCARGGKVYLVSTYPSIIRVDGLDTLRRLPEQALEVTAAQLEDARLYYDASEQRRQAERAASAGPLRVALPAEAPVLDGDLGDWPTNAFVVVDVRQKQVGDWGRRRLETRAALAVHGERLYAAFRTGEPGEVVNAATTPQNLFKTGGALDVMLGADPAADPARRQPAAGDLRLLVAQVKDKSGKPSPVALLYRAVVPGHTGDRVPFSSPLRTVHFDEVRDVTADIALAQGKDANDRTVVPNPGGDFEFSIPLAVLGLQPKSGLRLRGDIGVLRGSEIQTTQRAYWTNKATGLVSDIPSEAELTPHLWGWFEFAQ
jgi:hypothetical protein